MLPYSDSEEEEDKDMIDGNQIAKVVTERYLGRDRLTELPDEVLIIILSFLPTEDAVRTMLLRRFGDLWTLVPTLDLDYYSTFARDVLMFHQASSIDTFKLKLMNTSDFNTTEFEDSDDEDVCDDYEAHKVIAWALKRKAKAIHISVDDHDKFYLPDFVFTSQSLVELSLCCVNIVSDLVDRRRRVHMGSLRRLILTEVPRLDETFSSIIAGMPLLEELTIDDYGEYSCNTNNEFNDLSSSAPSIRKLKFHESDNSMPRHHYYKISYPYVKQLDYSGNVTNVKPSDLSSVLQASIGSFCNVKGAKVYMNEVKVFLENLQCAEFLTLSSLAFTQLSFSSKKVGFPQNKWKCVKLTTYPCEAHIRGIWDLLKNTPYLEELVLYITNDNEDDDDDYFYDYGYDYYYDDEEEEELEESAQLKDDKFPWKLPPFEAPCLRVVHIKSCFDHLAHIVLTEYLLKCATNLDKLVISSEQLTVEKEQQLVEKLAVFPRASATARIIFA